ncbi:glutamate ABC transporter substrate-binding protein [Actinomadura rudentiformis]|uniref:Glutamate ABC transporter substrate-binding protein n=1 Tax=Actinomadura rudentiformis TaxID=359158 RepID=A0A6H9YVK8_9ACTN|nr:glutamate ABC transporter substrate-binding protein [Actinomadura rudentiformis]KAB2345633.1 glutamate ABC transporter substrate-binding protein [Actinomadura rudentiformis]
MRVSKYGVALAALAAGSMALSGCAEKKDDSVADKDKLIVGVKYDQPALGLKSGSGVEGFDVDVAKYIGKKMGKTVEFKEAKSANRETFLANGTVDMVIATYSITEARKPKVTFAGPYIITHQDIMVRKDDSSIKDLASLKGKKLCAVAGSNSWKNITEGTNKTNTKVAAETVPAQGYDDCITKLKGDSLDAVSTDATILAGFVARDGGATMKVVNSPFTDEKYGVGLKKNDKKGCEAVNKAITDMYKDGTAKQLWDKWFGKAGLPFEANQPPAEGCDS